MSFGPGDLVESDDYRGFFIGLKTRQGPEPQQAIIANLNEPRPDLNILCEPLANLRQMQNPGPTEIKEAQDKWAHLDQLIRVNLDKAERANLAK